MSANRPPPNRGESLIRSATELKRLKDSSNDFADTPHGVADAKLHIKPLEIQSGRSDADRATANESRSVRCCKIRT